MEYWNQFCSGDHSGIWRVWGIQLCKSRQNIGVKDTNWASQSVLGILTGVLILLNWCPKEVDPQWKRTSFLTYFPSCAEQNKEGKNGFKVKIVQLKFILYGWLKQPLFVNLEVIVVCYFPRNLAEANVAHLWRHSPLS